MPPVLFLVYISSIIFATIISALKYRKLTVAMRMILLVLVLTSVSELCSYWAVINKQYRLRYEIYHFFNILQAVLLTAYFIYAIRPGNNKKLMVVNCCFWAAAGGLNMAFLQPITMLNSNMLTAESFVFITLSLYLVYRIIKDDTIDNILTNPHFRISVLLLVMWSCSLFFWIFIDVLYQGHWPYMRAAMYAQVIADILVYTGLGLTLFLYPAQTNLHEQP